jgi:hypothetical protein
MRQPLLCLLMTIFSGIASGQISTTTVFPKNELTVAYGVATIPEIAVTFGSLFATAISNQEVDDIRGGGALLFSYNHYRSPKFSWGVTGIYEKVTTVYLGPPEEYDWTALSIMANAKYYYIARPSFRLYSGLSAGYCSLSGKSMQKKDTNGAFAWQLNGIGARFGNRIGVLAEMGFGFEGIVKAGFSLRF